MRFNVYADVVPYAATSWVAEQVVIGLLQRGHKVATIALDQDLSKEVKPAPEFLLTVGSKMDRATKVVVRPLVRLTSGLTDSAVVVTIWETDAITSAQADILNLARAVVVPSQWLRDVFQRCGVKTPVHVVNYGIDSAFKPTLGTFPKQTVFLTAGRTSHGRARKGIDVVMAAFLLAFPTEKDVVLQVKVHDDDALPEITSSRIQVLRGFWRQDTLVAWYCQGLAFVSGACAEGWGLHQHEAMACGKPVIAAPFGALKTFFRPPTNGYAVGFKVEKSAMVGRWAHPSVESMAEVMRKVYEEPVNAFLCGLMAAKSVEHLTLARMQAQHEETIRRYA